MKKSLLHISLIVLAITFYQYDVNAQSSSRTISTNIKDPEVTQVTNSYSMRLDFMTESQIDEVILSGMVSLSDLCDRTMGCQSRKDVVLAEGDRIQLFVDARLKNVELIELDQNKKTSIAQLIKVNQENYILVPKKIKRDNIENFMLLFVN